MNRVFIFGLIALFGFSGESFSQVPVIKELLETGPMQRRDLSIPGSRIVINPYHYNKPGSEQVSTYTNRATLPLNIAYLLGTNNLEPRFGRQVQDMLVLFKKEGSGLQQASSYETSWAPHELGFSASYADGVKLTGTDFFFDENTVLRTLESVATGNYVIGGRIRGAATYHEAKNVMTVHHPNGFTYGIACNRLLKNIRYYASENDLKKEENPLPGSEGAAWWAAEINNVDKAVIGVTIQLQTVKELSLINMVKKAATDNSASRALQRQARFWNRFLSEKVPHPLSFELTAVPAKGVTANDVRLAYYKAWVFLAQSVMKPDPAFPYWQIVTGKPSMWDEGHSKAPFSASWESFVGMQLYRYIDPAVCWSALKGLLSLVDEQGMLGGESLPSKKAETAWALYAQTHDKKSLREVYPAIKRYLNWRITQPRWIHKDATRPENKDAEFVVAALKDIQFARQIAAALSLSEEATEWNRKYDAFYQQYLQWFWSTPNALPVQHYATDKRRGGHPVQITTGLYIDELSGSYLDGMMRLFYDYYNSSRLFAGFNAPKYPDVNYTVYGLINKGHLPAAKGVLESNIRDIVSTGPFFAESYSNAGDRPLPAGVRPSLFGMASLIDFVLLKNNFFYQKGEPALVNLFNNRSGIEGICIGKKRLNIMHEQDSHVLNIAGSYAGKKAVLTDSTKIVVVK
ncbi:MAG: hypothetical protein QM727_05770 [Niabella sp.]